MADQILTLTIPDAKVTKALEGFLKIYPNIEREEQTDPEVEPDLKYTDKQWVTEKVRRIMVRDIRRGLQLVANETATVAEDDGVVT